MQRLLFPVFDRRRHTLWRRQVVACLLMACLLLQSATAVAPGPAWWTTQEVLDPYSIEDDFAAANIGQLKHIATKAAAAINAARPGGEDAGEAINDLIAQWTQPPSPGVVRDDFHALNQGQLKNVAQLFHTRLGLAPPWAGGATVQDDHVWVNVGQLKNVFSFEVRSRQPGELAVIPPDLLAAAKSAWTALGANKPEGSTEDDFDGDGIPNLQEYLMGSPLFDPDDIDGDRIPDAVEDLYPGILSKLDFSDAVADHDGDGVMNFEEILLGLDLDSAYTAGRSDGLSDAWVLAWGLIVPGAPLTPSTDAIAAAWLRIDAAWVDLFFGDYAWLDEADADNDGEADGLTAFRAEFWAIDAGYIEYPPPPDDLDGDSIPDMDRDSDGMPDLWEYRYSLNLRDWQDWEGDPDEDLLFNMDEFIAGTNPRLADTDGDGFEDAAELLEASDPLQATSQPPLTLAIVGSTSQYVYPQQLASPFVVQVTQGGLPRAGAVVSFTLSSGTGSSTLRPATGHGSASSTVSVTTGSDGIAAVNFLSAAQTGSATITASATGATSVDFTASVVAVPEGWAGGSGGNGSGGSTTTYTPPRSSAQTAEEMAAAMADGYLIQVQTKGHEKSNFPPLPVSYLGDAIQGAWGGYEPAAGVLPTRSWAVHTKLTFLPLPTIRYGGISIPWATLLVPPTRVYVVRLYKGANVDEVNDPNHTWVAEGTSILSFSYSDTGVPQINLGGNVPSNFIQTQGNTVLMTPDPPGGESGRYRLKLNRLASPLLPVEVKIVNRDDPAKTWTTGPVTSGPLAYTSPTISEVSDVKNGDLISWSVPGLTGGAFQWWATGPNNSRKDAASSVTSNEWKLEDPLDWLPGKWRIHCKHTPSSGSPTEFDFEQNLGYRSPHITVIGWINGNEVVLPDGSQPPNVRMWPQGTTPSPLSIGSIMGNFVTRNIFMLELVEGNVYPVPLSPDGARKYVNSHLIKYSPNTEPTSDFTIDWPGKANRKMVNLSALRDFKADKRLFRAFHQFQVRFELDESAKIKGEPVYLIPSSDTTECGYTPTDVGNLSSEIGPLNNKIVKAGESLQINPKNGLTLTAKLPNDVAQINQGRISTIGVTSGGHLSKQLNNLVVPWIWSMITFSSSYASSGSTQVPQHEIFPSYHVLYNGRRIDSLTHHISSEKIEEFIQLGEAP